MASCSGESVEAVERRQGFRWNREDTLLLISQYKEHVKLFRNVSHSTHVLPTPPWNSSWVLAPVFDWIIRIRNYSGVSSSTEISRKNPNISKRFPAMNIIMIQIHGSYWKQVSVQIIAEPLHTKECHSIWLLSETLALFFRCKFAVQ